jgi:DNA primase
MGYNTSNRIILKSSQIEDWVRRHFDYKRRHNGDELLLNNPFDGDINFKFNVNTVKGVCHDWRPGHQQHDGSFIRFVQKYKNISFYEAIQEICGQDVDLKSILHPHSEVSDEPEDDVIPDVSMPPGSKSFRDNNTSSKIQKIALSYLESRGITLGIACKHDLHYGGDRIYFPYYEYGIQVYWQSRSIHSKTFEFPDLKTAGIGKESFLYGFDNAEPSQSVFIVESIFNAMTIGDGAVSSGGASMGLPQAKKVRALGPDCVVLAPDRDWEGVMSIIKNAELIQSVVNIDIKCVIPPRPYKDWNEMWRDDIHGYIKSNVGLATPVHVNRLLATI